MRHKLDTSVVLAYLETSSAPDHRYKSWDNCYQAFSGNSPEEIHALHLGFYLASWGMYRGSSGLLHKNHLVHKGAVEIIFKEKYQKLKCGMEQEISHEMINDILDLKRDLGEHYVKQFTKFKPISPTDTLISKVLLGTLGCVPAYDRFLIDGLKAKGMQHFKFQEDSLKELFWFIMENEVEISQCQKQIIETTGLYYPLMKIVDMFFWQVGYGLPQKVK